MDMTAREWDEWQALPNIPGEDMVRLTKDLSMGAEPDSTYTEGMRVHYDHARREFDRVREEYPNAILWIPGDTDGGEDVPEGDDALHYGEPEEEES